MRYLHLTKRAEQEAYDSSEEVDTSTECSAIDKIFHSYADLSYEDLESIVGWMKKRSAFKRTQEVITQYIAYKRGELH